MSFRTSPVIAWPLGGLLVLGACGSHAPAIDCEVLALAAPRGVPGTPIALLGVDTLTMTDVEVVVSDGAIEVPGAVLADADGAVRLIAPAHPTGALEGGPVTIQIGSCAPIAFTIDPLTPAPGEVARLLEVLQGQLAPRFSQLGLTRAAVHATAPDQLHPLAALMEAMASALDSAVTAYPQDGKDDPGTQLLEAMIARHGIVERLAERGGGGTALALSPPRSLYHRVAFTRQLPQNLAACGVVSREVTSAEQLACFMGAAKFYELTITGAPRQTLDLLGVVLGVGAAIPFPVTSPAFAATGLGLTIDIAMNEAMASLLPRRFSGLDVRVTPDGLDEDDPSPVRWDQAMATAVSDTWDPNAAIAGVFLSAFTAKANAPGLKELQGTMVGVINRARSMLAQNVAANLGGLGISLALPSTPDMDFRFPTLGPITYTGTDVTDIKWTEARLIGEGFTLGPRGVLLPERAGTSTLRLTIRPEEFLGASFTLDRAVTVRAISVEVSPPSVPLKAGESADLTVRVTNAKDTRVRWELVPAGEYTMTVLADGRGARVTARRDAEGGRAEVRATSLANRAHLTVRPERVGIGVVQGNAVRIEPIGACVIPGETLDLVSNGPRGVMGYDWSTTGGSVTEDGVFRAPSGGSGVATVRVVAQGDPSIQGEREVEYGSQCACRGTLTLGPPVGRTWTGLASWSRRAATFGVQLMPSGSAEALLVDPARRIAFGATMPGAPTVGSHRVREAMIAGNLNRENQVWGAVDPTAGDPASAELQIRASDDSTRIEGRLTGTIEVATASYSGKVAISYTFRALIGSALEGRSPFFTCYMATQPDD